MKLHDHSIFAVITQGFPIARMVRLGPLCRRPAADCGTMIGKCRADDRGDAADLAPIYDVTSDAVRCASFATCDQHAI